MSDMAANTVGHPQTDHLRTMALVEAGMEFATEVLRPGGAYVAKVLAGGADNNLVAELKRHFTTVKHAKPPASRKDSSEWYVIAQGFKGRPRWRMGPRASSPANGYLLLKALLSGLIVASLRERRGDGRALAG